MLISDCEARKGGEHLLSKPYALIGARQNSVVLSLRKHSCIFSWRVLSS